MNRSYKEFEIAGVNSDASIHLSDSIEPCTASMDNVPKFGRGKKVIV